MSQEIGDKTKIADDIIDRIKKGIRYTYQNGRKTVDITPAGVYLVMKNNENDIGTRPLVDISFSPPCIWVESTNREGKRILEPQVGGQYRIAAKVYNIGLMASYATFVEFYWLDPTSSEPISTRIHSIGEPKLSTINAGSSVIVRSDVWIPKDVNEGHECIIVRVYDPILDPIYYEQYDQNVDRHVGQRNINIIKAAVGTNSLLAMNLGVLKQVKF